MQQNYVVMVVKSCIAGMKIKVVRIFCDVWQRSWVRMAISNQFLFAKLSRPLIKQIMKKRFQARTTIHSSFHTLLVGYHQILQSSSAILSMISYMANTKSVWKKSKHAVDVQMCGLQRNSHVVLMLNSGLRKKRLAAKLLPNCYK